MLSVSFPPFPRTKNVLVERSDFYFRSPSSLFFNKSALFKLLLFTLTLLGAHRRLGESLPSLFLFFLSPMMVIEAPYPPFSCLLGEVGSSVPSYPLFSPLWVSPTSIRMMFFDLFLFSPLIPKGSGEKNRGSIRRPCCFFFPFPSLPTLYPPRESAVF